MADQEEPPELGRLSDSSGLWRASLWGGAAVVALAAAILITQTDIGAQRLQTIFSAEPPPKPVIQADFVPRADADALKRETLRLEAQVRELAADREKLNARIASLETSLSDMTGSIKREIAAVAAKASPPPAPPAPVVSAPATTPPPARLEAIEPEAKAAPAPTPPAPVAAAAAPPSEPVPLPPTRVATVTPVEPASPAGKDTGLGIDLGGARSMDIMQARWAAVKANFGPLLYGLRPLVARDDRPNMIPYRLIVGPLPNAATAAQVCARFTASKVTCRATKFAGEPLASGD